MRVLTKEEISLAARAAISVPRSERLEFYTQILGVETIDALIKQAIRLVAEAALVNDPVKTADQIITVIQGMFMTGLLVGMNLPAVSETVESEPTFVEPVSEGN